MSHPDPLDHISPAVAPAASASATPLPATPALRIAHLRVLRGPNPWYLRPAILCELDGGATAPAPDADAACALVRRLAVALPELPDALGVGDGRDDALLARLPRAALLAQLVQRTAIALQRAVGAPVSFGRATPADDGLWRVLVAYEEEAVGERSVHDAVALVQQALEGETPSVTPVLQRLGEVAAEVRLGPSTAALVAEARRRHVPVRRLGVGSLVQLGTGRHQRRLQAAITDGTSGIAMEVAQDKDITKRLLARVGIPTPAGTVVRGRDEALVAAGELGFPVLLKPLDGNHGRGVSDPLDDADDVRSAWDAAREVSREVVVERYVAGRDYRVLVVGGRMVACAERIPAHVVGDGRRTVRALVEQANADPRRGPGHTAQLTLLPLDERAEAHLLARHGHTLDTVPAAGECVSLCGTANLSTGGTAIDRTDEIHPDNVAVCELAARVVGLDVAGIDVLAPDIAQTFATAGGAIVEVNASPGLRMHLHPTEGTPRDVAAPILDLLYPAGAPSAVPIIAITGTNGKTTTTRLIAHLLRLTGRTVGCTTTDGVYVDDRLVEQGDMTGPTSAELVLANPLVDAAVLETARGGLLRAGLGFERCDVGVVLNVAADHLGLRGVHTLEQLAEVKAVIPAVVQRDGTAVLNADDPRVLAMRQRTVGRVALFSLAAPGENAAFEAHLAGGGLGARIERDVLVLRRGARVIPVVPVRDVPLALGGAARYQIQNCLAAALAAYALGVDRAALRAGLLSFAPSPALTPGRMNVLPMGRGRLIVDYAHNPPAVAALVETVAALTAQQRVAVIGAPGDRRDDDLREIGRLCAGTFDRVIVREDADRRGRAPGETARLLHEGLRAGGMPEERVEHVLPEHAAIERACELLDEGDLAVALVEDVAGVLAQAERLARGA